MWSEECEKSFNKLEQVLTSELILRVPNMSKPFFVQIVGYFYRSTKVFTYHELSRKLSDCETPEPISVTNKTSVTNTPEPTLVTNKTENITTAGSTSSTPAEKPSSHTHTVKISETNLLLVTETDADSLFIELQGKPGEDLTGLWLTVHNAGMTTGQDTLLLKVRLESSVNSSGIHLMDKTTGLDFENVSVLF
ncbi:hypothetical protein PoB_004378500 [Plakobranchus ocellatus]|uniref:Uncharacterized protein n=1 Tax=Plakobranchus ocellatus TaxID=259542 RepID=A0AAV4BDV9_9GAST|nr:hypothetical protein PoB_004378500 [Plakobranchus ocellatus]